MAAPAVPPIRRDVYVSNEATGFLITSRAMGGRAIEPDGGAWTDEVQAGRLLPIELVQDDPFFIRVVVADALTPRENDEWVGRLGWILRVPDGRLAIAGGVEFVMEPFDESATSEYVRLLDVPAGDYRAVLYAYLSGVNGEFLLNRATPDGVEPEPAGAFFRRTRPGERFPLWLRSWCVAYPSKDPGHEAEWHAKTLPDDKPEYVDFLLQLTPLGDKPEAMPPLEGGFFSAGAFEIRKPERCPVGLQTRDVLRPEKQPAPPPRPVETVDVHSLIVSHRLAPVGGGAVDLRVRRLVRAYRLAWFATDSAAPELRVTLPPGVAWTPTLDGLEECAVTSTIERGFRIGFAQSGGKWTALGWLDALGPKLSSMPDGSTLELMTAQPEPDGNALVGLLRFRGSVEAGMWRIAEAFPAVPAARLRQALALAAQPEEGSALVLHGSKEAQQVRERFLEEWESLVKDNPLKQQGGIIRPAKADSSIVALLAAEAFRLGFADIWTMPGAEVKLDAAEIIATAAGLKRPTKGERILEGTGGRDFHRSDMLSLGEKVAARVEEADRVLPSLGYVLLGDLICTALGDIVLRGYAKPDGDAWAVLIQGTFGPDTFDFVTRFEKGGALTTTRTRGAADHPEKRDFKTSLPKADLATLHAEHEKRKAELAGKHGHPLPVPLELVALARAIDEALQKDLG